MHRYLNLPVLFFPLDMNAAFLKATEPNQWQQNLPDMYIFILYTSYRELQRFFILLSG